MSTQHSQSAMPKRNIRGTYVRFPLLLAGGRVYKASSAITLTFLRFTTLLC
jgi:aminoglycoside phosphotransferase family enzyme